MLKHIKKVKNIYGDFYLTAKTTTMEIELTEAMVDIKEETSMKTKKHY